MLANLIVIIICQLESFVFFFAFTWMPQPKIALHCWRDATRVLIFFLQLVEFWRTLWYTYFYNWKIEWLEIDYTFRVKFLQSSPVYSFHKTSSQNELLCQKQEKLAHFFDTNATREQIASKQLEKEVVLYILFTENGLIIILQWPAPRNKIGQTSKIARRT